MHWSHIWLWECQACLSKFAWREFLGGEKEKGSAGLAETAAYERVIFGLENELDEFEGI